MFRLLLTGSLLLISIPTLIMAATTPAGQAIEDAGGSDFSIRAADAVHVTCMDLIAKNSGNGLQQQEQDLFARCGEMVRTSLGITTNSYIVSGDSDVFALLRQFSGEEASSQGRYAVEGSDSQFANVGARLSAIRSGARGSAFAFNFQGIDLAQAAHNNQKNSQTPTRDLVGGGAGSADADSGFAWFGTANYGFGDRDSSVNEDGFDADSYGVTFGVDYVFENGFVVGAALGYDAWEIEFDSSVAISVNDVSGGSMDTDGVTLSAFFDHHMGSAYVSGILSVASLDYDIDRIVAVSATTSGTPASSRLIKSDTEGEQISGQMQFGYSFGDGATTFDLFGGLEVQNVEIDAYVETDTSSGGGLGLAFGDQDIDSAQSILGATLRRAVSTGQGVVVPYISVEWRHEFSNNSRFVDARYAFAVGDLNNDGLSDNFALPTDGPDENFFDVTVGLTGQFGNNMALFIQYRTLLGLEDTASNLITAGVRGVF
ncbi:MAG: autotransporter outer membrane beta-barrel domain-containing protein [Gammaproteobacteria bacterium]|nr:autotransporter outer membrane beta-barrel domain-containing protein [Gammaproteobacteria bacterium]